MLPQAVGLLKFMLNWGEREGRGGGRGGVGAQVIFKVENSDDVIL